MWAPVALDGEHVVAVVLLARHEQTKLLHALGAPSRLRLPLGDLSSPRPVAVLLVELLLPSLPLPLEALDNVDGPSDVHVIIVAILDAPILSHLRKQRGWARQGLGVSCQGSTGEVELHMRSLAWRSGRGREGSGGWRLGSPG